MKAVTRSVALLLFFATLAFGQVRVDVHLERTEYLRAEPVVVVVDVLNVGDESVQYSASDADVRLTIVPDRRRVPPNIFGCYSGLGSGSVSGVGDPPSLAPGQATSFRYLLKGYDLFPGHYTLTASGKAGVRGAIPGAQFERTLSLDIVTATETGLRLAFAPLVSGADSPDPVVRIEARAAIVESAPGFLEPLIARFAREVPYDMSAIDALGRLATPDSRSHLRELFEQTGDGRRPAAVLALARIGDAQDAEFLSRVLENAGNDMTSRQYAALGLGHIGGDEAVHRLEHAVLSSSAELRPTIATALGNTHSGAAVPALIGMFGNNPSRNDVCGALLTLTHRSWCDGSRQDPAAARRHWLRKWIQEAATSAIYDTENCLKPESPGPAVPGNSKPVAATLSTGKTPSVNSVTPAVAFPRAVVTLSGEALGLEDLQRVRVVFKQGDIEHQATVTGGGGIVGRDPDAGVQYIDVAVPDGATRGRWQVVVEVGGRRSASLPIDVTTATPPVVTRVSPAHPHPSQWVSVNTRVPAQVDDRVQLTDARGHLWLLQPGVRPSSVDFVLPDDVADGEAIVRVGNTRDGVDHFSTPLRFVITSGPLPLAPEATRLMKAVAPGQWTDLARDADIEFELTRADRVEVEFRQNDRATIAEAAGWYHTHVQVPAGVSAGLVRVRTRTWIEQTVSEWSMATDFQALTSPVPPSVIVIETWPARTYWHAGDASPATATPGDFLVLSGQFPVARAADLAVQLRGSAGVINLRAADAEDGVRIDLPAETPRGDWQLFIGPIDGRTPMQNAATVRLM